MTDYAAPNPPTGLMHGITEMTENILELNAFLEHDKKREPLHVKILAAERAEGQPDYSCLIHAPLLLDQDKKIYGVDQDQAKFLAIGFVKSLLRNKKVVDGNGTSVNF
jgi:hypothetical protein